MGPMSQTCLLNYYSTYPHHCGVWTLLSAQVQRSGVGRHWFLDVTRRRGLPRHAAPAAATAMLASPHLPALAAQLPVLCVVDEIQGQGAACRLIVERRQVSVSWNRYLKEFMETTLQPRRGLLRLNRNLKNARINPMDPDSCELAIDSSLPVRSIFKRTHVLVVPKTQAMEAD